MSARSLYSQLLQDYTNIYGRIRLIEEMRNGAAASVLARRIVPACVVIAGTTLATFGTVATAARAQSSITYTTATGTTSASSGNTLGAEAIFTILNSTSLQIDIYNTNGATLNRADILTTVLFNLDSSVTVNTATGKNGANDVVTGYIPSTSFPSNPTNPTFTPSSQLINASTGAAQSPQPSVNGSYIFNNVSSVTALKASDGQQFKYGVSSVGYSGGFSSQGFTTGGGSDDYGIVGYGTSGMNSGPLVFSDGVRITVNNLSGLTSVSQIKEVSFGYGSGQEPLAGGGTGYVLMPGMNPTPTPSAAASLIIGALVGTMTIGRQQRRAKKSAAKAVPVNEPNLF